MDDLLQRCLSFPPHPPPAHPLSDEKYDEAIRIQVDALKKVNGDKLLLQTTGGENALDVINPALNTVPYAYLLTANHAALKKGNNKAMPARQLFARMSNFLKVYDARQIRYVGHEFANIIEGFASLASHNRTPWDAVESITTALLRLDPTGTMLTSSHVVLVNMALQSRNYQHAVPVLEKFILYVPGIKDQPRAKFLCDMSLSPPAYITTWNGLTGKFKYAEILEYFYLSGMVFIGLRKWEAAKQCLEHAVTFPAKDNQVSKIMVEAYKKWVLVGVLAEGKLLPLPKSTSPGAAKAYHVLAKPYETFAQIFESGTASRLKAEAEAGSQKWWEANHGLILHVLAAYQRFHILKLAEVYSKISISEIIKETTSAESGSKLPNVTAGEQLVRDMINAGELHATLGTGSNGQAILTFLPTGKDLNEAQMKRELALSTIKIQALTNEIKTTDRMLTHDKDWVKYATKMKKNPKDDHGVGMDDSFGDADPDEDLMG